MVVPVPSVFSRPERSLNVWDLLDTHKTKTTVTLNTGNSVEMFVWMPTKLHPSI